MKKFKNKVQLNGQAKLNLHTGESLYHAVIPKNDRNGENNADHLIDTVLHFAVMRHGKKRLTEIFNKKLSEYDSKYDEQGLFPDSE